MGFEAFKRAALVKISRLFSWRPCGILDEAGVNKGLVTLPRRETMAALPFNRFSDLSAVESFQLTFVTWHLNRFS
jgi:hypothetical protein